MAARLVGVSLTPKPRVGLRVCCWPRHRQPRKRRPREFVLLQTVGVAEGLEAVSSGDPSEARRDKQRETAVVQTQSDELAVYDDESESCRSKIACMFCLQFAHHMTSVDALQWRGRLECFSRRADLLSPRSPHICNRNAYFCCRSGGAKDGSLLIYWIALPRTRAIHLPSYSSPKVQRRLFISLLLCESLTA